MALVIAAERLGDVSKKVRLNDVVQGNIRAGEQTRQIMKYEAAKIYEQLCACRDAAFERIREIEEMKEAGEWDMQDREMQIPTGIGVIYLNLNGEHGINKRAINTFKSYFRRASEFIWHDLSTLAVAYVSTPHKIEVFERPEYDKAAKRDLPAITRHVNSLWRALSIVLRNEGKQMPKKYFKHDYSHGFGDEVLSELADRIVYHAVGYRRLFESMKELQETGIGPDF